LFVLVLETLVEALAVTGTGPNAGGGTRWWVADSYADATLITSES
jgi:hypothetical protein